MEINLATVNSSELIAIYSESKTLIANNLLASSVSEGDYSDVWHPLVQAAASMGGITMARKVGDYLTQVEQRLEEAIWVKKTLPFKKERNDIDHSDDAPGRDQTGEQVGTVISK